MKAIDYIIISVIGIGFSWVIYALPGPKNVQQSVIDENHLEEQTLQSQMNQIEELKDCKVKVIQGQHTPLKIVRCPVSSTTAESICGRSCYSRSVTTEQ